MNIVDEEMDSLWVDVEGEQDAPGQGPAEAAVDVVSTSHLPPPT